jgi:hypothetical protein
MRHTALENAQRRWPIGTTAHGRSVIGAPYIKMIRGVPVVYMRMKCGCGAERDICVKSLSHGYGCRVCALQRAHASMHPRLLPRGRTWP